MIGRSEIFDYVKKKYDVTPDYPFEKYHHYAALRHLDDEKWFGLVMNVPRDKLGLDGEGEVDILDVKCQPAKVDDLKKKTGFRPAYHMNKQHWLTVLLDGTVPKQDILNLLDESYDLTK
ncbi:protein of unknown function DUF419 (plasmid) [Rhizobium leguminosarum bv. trifolii WSM2304]|uniref:MmcQ/YjbR family DNA-binding protein n=1 Tax=Rhizobium leguminosarum bv. trifolii (strain WSM2304) TaxID=395492 RepID=A0ABF7QZL2_RHILW|nr:MmcQ/YjbR family DNA-binding protein [Rhizobium leguminosarum]ACI59477.1 protein of unknown function DUF419 [Rhizobium leguminosarum bv. trifolii WSM2304]